MPERAPNPGEPPPPAPRSVKPARTPDVGLSGVVADQATDRLAKVAHELGNLLDGALRYVSLARSGLRDPREADDTVAHELDIAHEALTRMAKIVRASLSRAGSPSFSGLIDPRPLAEAVMHAVDLLKPLADDRGIRLDVEFSPRLVLVSAGPIYPVVANAVRNAIEAVGRDGSVKVVAELVTVPATGMPEVQIDVIDDGPGPPPGVGDAVFDLGYTTKHGGLGVGLALSREIVRELGGWISLTPRLPEPKRRRRGAHFCVRYRPPAG